MKKVGIITICDYNNYGNRLQNYAVQEVLKSLGLKVETIKNEHPICECQGKSKWLIRFHNLRHMSRKEVINKIINITVLKLLKKDNSIIINKRIEKFKLFTYKYINETDFIISKKSFPIGLEEKYDYFVTGSDQVWNPNCRFGSFIDFLTFASRCKRIAYAPSFGVSSIPKEFVEKYSIWLSEIDNLSVREEVGAQIIKSLTGKNAIVVIDPTLMLTKDKWLSISKQACNRPKGNYLLTYFLGNITKEYKQVINKLAFEYNLEIVQLMNINDKDRYTVDPAEFLDYINSSTLLLTDSFHGVVFSILFSKSFIVFERPSMNSRIETLLTKFNLNSRRLENLANIKNLLSTDYSHIPSILEVERNKALDFLKNAFQII